MSSMVGAVLTLAGLALMVVFIVRTEMRAWSASKQMQAQIDELKRKARDTDEHLPVVRPTRTVKTPRQGHA